MRSLPLLLRRAGLWALVAWLGAALVLHRSLDLDLLGALTHYYSVRAPLVGALIGGVGGPLLRGGRLWRALVGSLLFGAGTFLLLFLWPNDMQNTRMDAGKWALFYWKSYWPVLLPLSWAAGLLTGTPPTR